MHRVRGVEPERVLVVEAAEMELEPGEVRLVDDKRAQHMPVREQCDADPNVQIDGSHGTAPGWLIFGGGCPGSEGEPREGGCARQGVMLRSQLRRIMNCSTMRRSSALARSTRGFRAGLFATFSNRCVGLADAHFPMRPQLLYTRYPSRS